MQIELISRKIYQWILYGFPYGGFFTQPVIVNKGCVYEHVVKIYRNQLSEYDRRCISIKHIENSLKVEILISAFVRKQSHRVNLILIMNTIIHRFFSEYDLKRKFK